MPGLARYGLDSTEGVGDLEEQRAVFREGKGARMAPSGAAVQESGEGRGGGEGSRVETRVLAERIIAES